MMWIWSELRVMKNYRIFFHVPITYIPLSSSLMKYLTLPFPSSTLLALYRKVNYPQIYTPNLPTPINTFCLAAVILPMWLRAYHTVKLLESGEFAQPTNLWKNDWVNLKIIWKEGVTNKVLSRKVGEGSGDRLRSPAGPEQNPGWGARGANPESSWVLRI